MTENLAELERANEYVIGRSMFRAWEVQTLRF
jgi:hypothetical protein